MSTHSQRIHPLAVRITHWINAAAIVVMIGSGWQIYNASPLFPFVFPSWMTLGGWLGGALAWHFAAMWLLAGNFAIYLGYGLISGHIRRRLLPLRPREIWRDAMLALRFRLPHDGSHYNAVQRLLYVSAGCGIVAGDRVGSGDLEAGAALSADRCCSAATRSRAACTSSPWPASSASSSCISRWSPSCRAHCCRPIAARDGRL